MGGDKPGLGDSPFRTHAVTRHTGRDTRAGMDAGLDPRQGHEPAVRQFHVFGRSASTRFYDRVVANAIVSSTSSA